MKPGEAANRLSRLTVLAPEARLGVRSPSIYGLKLRPCAEVLGEVGLTSFLSAPITAALPTSVSSSAIAPHRGRRVGGPPPHRVEARVGDRHIAGDARHGDEGGMLTISRVVPTVSAPTG